jgi:hypothetical protein
MKLREKIRIGSKVIKKYDTAKTPYQRLIESPYIQKETKNALMKQYETLNPAELKREITKLQNRLLRLPANKKNIHEDKEDFVYNFCEATSNHFV